MKLLLKGDIALKGKGHLYIDAEKNRDKLSAWEDEDDEYISLGDNRLR